MICIHNNRLNNIAKYNLLLDILNPSKLTKNINSHYYPILDGCMNTHRGKARFRNFVII